MLVSFRYAEVVPLSASPGWKVDSQEIARHLKFACDVHEVIGNAERLLLALYVLGVILRDPSTTPSPADICCHLPISKFVRRHQFAIKSTVRAYVSVNALVTTVSVHTCALVGTDVLSTSVALVNVVASEVVALVSEKVLVLLLTIDYLNQKFE